MPVPKGLVVQCPMCESFIEADTCGWSMSVGESEETGKGIMVEMMAWCAHDCSRPTK